jgi:hypothetical protein
MKMSKPGLCCDSCFEMIAQESTRAARLWLDLCELQLHSRIFGLLINDEISIRILETMGFILTTETPHMIVVKVNGFSTQEDGSFFCGGNCEE